jgi:formate dehydrogenase subunit gamma
MRSDRLADRISGVARLLFAVCFLTFTIGVVSHANAQSSVRPPASGDTGFSDPSVSGEVPGNALGSTSDSEIWRAVKGGATGNVSIPDKKAGMLVQYEGQIWREIHNGMVPLYGAWAILGIIVLLAVFFAVFGRLKIDDGPAGITITRFSALERAGHWMTAGSFVLLALTGLNILYGRGVIMPVIGPEAYAAIAQWGKYIHNYVAFAFIAGLIFIFFHWVLHNLPSRHDIVWLLKGGGIFVKSV